MTRIRPDVLWLGLAVAASAACGDDPRDLVGPVPSGLTLVSEVAIPPNYGIHDTFVRDGLAFVCAWNTGIIIYDVGHGIANGSPSDPQEVSSFVTGAAGLGGARAHNAWWFHNPNTGERRYLFVGQEGPGLVGVSASGDIHVLDVSDLGNPQEVATYHLDGAGAHNFWMDEQAQVLFAAYYNGGVVALDVSGTLTGDLAGREIDRIRPAADSTFVWGVQLHDGSVYATDMLNGLYQVRFSGSIFTRVAGGDGVGVERFSSDLWVHGDYAYTGTWGTRGQFVGNLINIWRLGTDGRPSLAGDLEIENIGTVADLEVSADGAVMLVSAERGSDAGVSLFDVRDPERPTRLAAAQIVEGVHTATLADIDGRRYAFAAKNPPQPALVIYEIAQ